MSLPYALLGLLAGRPMYGYELRQTFESALGGVWSVSYGQLYPALARMTAAGLVRKKTQAGDKLLDRQVYSLTDRGRAKFSAWVVKSCGSQVRIKDDLTLRMPFFRSLKPLAVSKYLQGVRDATAAQRASLAASLDSLTDPWLAAIVQRGIMHADAELAWLDDLLAGHA